MARFAGVLFFCSILWTGRVGAEEAGVSRYLVEGRFHVTVTMGSDGSGGGLCWKDTVTGQEGDAGFRSTPSRLLVETQTGTFIEAHLLPGIAIVFEMVPWHEPKSRLALGLSLD